MAPVVRLSPGGASSVKIRAFIRPPILVSTRLRQAACSGGVSAWETMNPLARPEVFRDRWRHANGQERRSDRRRRLPKVRKVA